MAYFTGKNGVVKIGTITGAVEDGGSETIGEVKEFSVEQSADTAEASVLGTTWKRFVTTTTSWNGSLAVLFDKDVANSNHDAFVIGAVLELILYLEDPAVVSTGDTADGFNGNAIVTGLSVSATNEDFITYEITFQGTEELTHSLVTGLVA